MRVKIYTMEKYITNFPLRQQKASLFCPQHNSIPIQSPTGTEKWPAFTSKVKNPQKAFLLPSSHSKDLTFSEVDGRMGVNIFNMNNCITVFSLRQPKASRFCPQQYPDRTSDSLIHATIRSPSANQTPRAPPFSNQS